MGKIQRLLYLGVFSIVFADLQSAAMIRSTANAFLANKISFINEIPALYERVGESDQSLAKGMAMDGRIGNKLLHAGPSCSGSCFRKDTSALARIGQVHGVPLQILEALISVDETTALRTIN